MALPNHPAINEYVGFLLRKVSHASFERFSAVVGAHDLHPMHFGMLAIVDADGPVSQRELSLRTGVDPSTMVARMDALVARGLVARERSVHDRRVYEISLTSEGRTVLRKLRVSADRHQEELFGVLDADEHAELHRLLTKLAERVDATEPAGS